MFLEGPKLLHKDGYYYMVSAEGGTAGPATSHMVVVARSKSVFGPWENSPYNPLVHTYNASDPWWSKGHGTLIDDAKELVVVYHAYAQGYHTLGRQTLIDPVEWTADGWVKLRHDARPLPAQDPEKHGLELSDDFTGKQLGLQWTFWKEYAPESLSFGKDGMSVKAKGKTPTDGRLLLTTATDKNYELTTEITLGKGNTGGLLLFYDEKAYAGVASDGKTLTIYATGEKPKPCLPITTSISTSACSTVQPRDPLCQQGRKVMEGTGHGYRRVGTSSQQLRWVLCPPSCTPVRRKRTYDFPQLHLP